MYFLMLKILRMQERLNRLEEVVFNIIDPRDNIINKEPIFLRKYSLLRKEYYSKNSKCGSHIRVNHEVGGDEKPPIKRRRIGSPATQEKKHPLAGYKQAPPPKPKVKKRKKPRSDYTCEYPEYVKHWLDVWTEEGFKLSAHGTKSFYLTVKAIKDLANGRTIPGRRVTFEDWHNSVSNAALASRNKEFMPLNKSFLLRMQPYQFLERFYNKNYSRFDIYEKPPKPMAPPEEDKYPVITEILIEHYQEYSKTVLKDGQYKPTPTDKNKFISASNRTMQFLQDNQDRIPNCSGKFFHNQWYKVADLLYDALRDTVRNTELTPGYFCSDLTFTRRLPQYLRTKEMWS